jgi:hypothetical protein
MGEVGADARLADEPLEFGDLLVGVLRMLPALRGTQEDLHALGSHRLRARDTRRESARRRHVRSKGHR